MKSSEFAPPLWAEALLERLLPEHARETVAGDLREEYVEAIAPVRGRLRAGIWYVRHVLSFISWFTKEGSLVGKILLAVSGFTLLCACWLGFMEMVLRHPGFVPRMLVAAAIAAICAATILARMLHLGFRGERWLWVGAAVLIALGVQAFVRNAGADHFDGFVVVISVVLVVQGALMLGTLGRENGGSSRTLDQMTPLH